jgi:hypothetical protein
MVHNIKPIERFQPCIFILDRFDDFIDANKREQKKTALLKGGFFCL